MTICVGLEKKIITRWTAYSKHSRVENYILKVVLGRGGVRTGLNGAGHLLGKNCRTR